MRVQVDRAVSLTYESANSPQMSTAHNLRLENMRGGGGGGEIYQHEMCPVTGQYIEIFQTIAQYHCGCVLVI